MTLLEIIKQSHMASDVVNGGWAGCKNEKLRMAVNKMTKV